MQSSASSNHSPSSPGAGSLSAAKTSTKLQQPSKTTSIKTKSSSITVPLSSLHNGTGSGGVRDLQTSLEIEEISKKISEHADALYRTWKSHGIAPTEIFDIYTAEAAAATGAITEDVKSTEGLHKLVNSFVIKDKEQRGVKTTNKLGGGSGVKSQTQKKARSPSPSRQSAAINNTTLKGTISSSLDKSVAAGGGGDNKKSSPSFSATSGSVACTKHNASSLKSSTTPSSSSASYLLNNKANRLGSDSHLEMDYTKPHITAATTGTTKLKTQKQAATSLNDATKLAATPSKSLDLNFDISLDLNLDIPALTLQQTENLLKIKELLQQESSAKGPIPTTTTTTTTVTKIPSVIIEKSPSASTKLKEVKVKKSPIVESNTKKLALNSTSGASLLGTNMKVNETPVLTKSQGKPAVGSSSMLADTTSQIAMKKIGQKTKATPRLNNSTDATSLDTLDNSNAQQTPHMMLNQTSSIGVIDKSNRKSDKNRDTSPSSGSSSSTTKKRNLSASTAINVSGLNSPITITNGSDTIDAINAIDNRSSEKLVLSKLSTSSSSSSKTAEEGEHQQLYVKQIAEPLDANATADSSPKLQQKSITKSAKPTKNVKEKSKESTVNAIKLKVPKDDLNVSTRKSPEILAATEIAAAEPSNMEVARSNGTSMLTPTKLKSTRPLTNGQEKSGN